MRIGSYASVFASAEHEPVLDLDYLRSNSWGNTLGLFYKGTFVGSGALVGMRRGDVHTTSVYLKDEFRHKGHGIPLYVHLVMTAKRLGAKRIFSDKRLNKFSRRMWSEKLPKIFPVKVIKLSHTCSRCRHRSHDERYVVDLARVKRPRLR